MNLEQTLTDELASVAGNLDVPPPPATAAVVQQAAQRRQRSRLRWAATTLLAAAAVVAAVVIGSQVGRPDASPQPTRPTPTRVPTVLPTGLPPQIPYIKNDKLYIEGQVQPGSWLGVVIRKATAVGYPDDANDRTESIVLFHDGVEVARVPDVSVQGVVLSPDGSKAAWVQRASSGTWYVVSYDVATGHELGRVAVGARALGHVGPETEQWEALSAVDDTGTAHWGGVLKEHTWTPGGVPQDSAAVPSPVPTPGEFPVDPGVVTLSPDGVWGAWTTDLSGDHPQGSSEAPDQYTTEVTAQKPGQPTSRIPFALPRNTNASGVQWETNATFLVQAFDDPTGVSWHFLRCSITTRRCEVAPTPEAP